MVSIRIHPLPRGEYVVSQNDLWLPGVYDSEETATRACDLPTATLLALGRIYRVDGENRALTMDDLDAITPRDVPAGTVEPRPDGE